MNKAELKEELVAKGIDFDAEATNKELEALLPEVEETTEEVVVETTVEEEDDDLEELSKFEKKLSDFQLAYKRQNPRKFKIKWDRGELKGL